MTDAQRQMTWDEVVAQMVVYRNERDALRAEIAKNGEHLRYVEGQETLRCAEVRALEAENAALKEQMTADRKQFLDVRDERDALRDALVWIATVNAMDYEYTAKARAAIGEKT